MAKRKRNKKKNRSQTTSSGQTPNKANGSDNSELDQLGDYQIEEADKIDLRAKADVTRTPASEDCMNDNLTNVAENVAELLGKMGTQLDKEDTQREKLLTFFKWFTCAITLGPVLLVAILYLLLKDSAGLVTHLATLAAFINIPVSSIGVLKCIAESLFNDTYRKTMPDMLTRITKALAQYNMVYSGKKKSDVSFGEK